MVLKRVVINLESTLNLIVPPLKMNRTGIFQRENLNRLIECLRDHFDMICIDMPGHLFSYIDMMEIDIADRFVFVSLPDIFSVNNNKTLIDHLEGIRPGLDCYLVINKYNMTIHILFWSLTAILILTAVMIVLNQSGQIESFIVKTETEVVVEPVYITQVKEVKEETEWFYFIATGYSANDPAQGTNNITATGKEIKIGMIAVDTKIIPLGTEVEIKDLGIFTAEDTGGKIKGNRIDIYFETREEAEKFGRKVIWVRILNNNIELAGLLSD